MRTELFPTFDGLTREFLCYKERPLVHTEGDWHRGVQANVIRRNQNGNFDFLVQQRSGIVDLSKYKFDQSLATQMTVEDDLNEESTLHRGLRDELGICSYLAKKRINPDFQIVKTYEEDPNKLNREFISLYIVLVGIEQQISLGCEKIFSVRWMGWNEFLTFFEENPSAFTQTAQFYFSNPLILSLIEGASFSLIQDQMDYHKVAVA